VPAYVVVEVNESDREQYAKYREAAPPAIAAYDGRYLTRDGRLETFEGDWTPPRVVILEFPSLERAREWYESEQYRAARALREGAATLRMVAIEGIEAR
jgi:uncharacterized protein (DUF1330 family)